MQVKSWLSMFTAAVLGGVVTVGGVNLLQKQNNKQAENTATGKYVNFENAPFAPPVPDFTVAAASAVDAVVHIKTTESAEKVNEKRQQMERQNPFFGFFDMEGFGGMGMKPRSGTGSGVIISEDGYIVTNNHVVEIGDEFQVTLNDNRQFDATLVGRAEDIDLAVLKIDTKGLKAMKYGNSDAAKVGQWVLAVGNPFDLTSTVTAGIISAKGRGLDKGSSKVESYIQTDAPVNPGNSGGALVDANTGNLIGINTAIVTHTGSYEGYSFAIPVNLMTKVVDDLIKYGNYQRGYLGVEIQDLNDEYAKELEVNVSKGVVVKNLTTGSSARAAGVRIEDVIVKVNGNEIKNGNELMEKVGSAKVGETVNLTILRGNDYVEIPVKLKARPKTTVR
jgi:serine protease Do